MSIKIKEPSDKEYKIFRRQFLKKKAEKYYDKDTKAEIDTLMFYIGQLQSHIEELKDKIENQKDEIKRIIKT